MADESKDGKVKTEHNPITGEETQIIDVTDDFDPFGVEECIEENIGIQLSAPPENE